MNPIFSEPVRRMLRRKRKAPHQLGAQAKDQVYSPSKRSQLISSKRGIPGFEGLKLLWMGLFGALITALCLVTSLPERLLNGIGLEWLIKYLAYGLFPALFIFIGIAVYGWWQNRA